MWSAWEQRGSAKFPGNAGYLDNFIQDYAAIAAPLYQLTRKETKFHCVKQEKEAFRKIQDIISSEKIMASFDSNKLIILRSEASFNEGLSAALLQKTDRGMQPVQVISRTMTETEKRYSQTEKDALAIKWAKERLRIYLLGAPRFRIVTAHKPLVPLFKTTIDLQSAFRKKLCLRAALKKTMVNYISLES